MVDDLRKSRSGYFNEPRNVAMYPMRRLRGDTLKDAGKMFGIDKNSTVSSSLGRVKSEMKKNRDIRGHVEELIQIVSKGQS